MILVDASLLLYAYHPRAAQHEANRRWLEAGLRGSGLVRFSWLDIWAFLRSATNPRVFHSSIAADRAAS